MYISDMSYKKLPGIITNAEQTRLALEQPNGTPN